MDLPIANHIHLQERRLIPGNYVALLCDSADPENDLFHHLCRVLAIEDDNQGRPAKLRNVPTEHQNGSVLHNVSRKRHSKIYHAKTSEE